MRSQPATRPHLLPLTMFLAALVIAASPSPATAQQPVQPESVQPAESDAWTFRNPFGSMHLPKPKMPQFKFRPAFSDSPEQEPGFLDGPVNRVRSATQAAASKTRMAWNKTVDKLKFRGRTSGAEGETTPAQPGFFARMFGTPEPERPRTVTEFLAQERPGTQRR